VGLVTGEEKSLSAYMFPTVITLSWLSWWYQIFLQMASQLERKKNDSKYCICPANSIRI